MGSPSGNTAQGTVRKMEKGIGGLLKLSREEHFTVVLWPMPVLMPVFLLSYS
jgi:hypothetical protein